MKCPRCARNLEVTEVGGVQVDVCQGGCGGIWFDAFELTKMDQPNESAGWLLEHIRIDLEVSFDADDPVFCPRCMGIGLMRQRYPSNHRLTVDNCRVCGGVWLDFGELFGIRDSNQASPAARAESAQILRSLKPEM